MSIKKLTITTLKRKDDGKIFFGISTRGVREMTVMTKDGLLTYTLKEIDEMYEAVMFKEVDADQMFKNAIKL